LTLGRIILPLGAAIVLAGAAWARPVCVGNLCYPSEAAARADGVSEAALAAALEAGDDHGDLPPTVAPPAVPGEAAPAAPPTLRTAMGYMDAATFGAFLEEAPDPAESLAGHALIVVFLLVLAGGLAANLTPCVLPLVPVNLILVGRGWRRGLAYGLGITCAYGTLGLVAAFGGAAFGSLQASPWFNLVAAVIFVVLGLATSGVFFIDLTRYRPRGAAQGARTGGLGKCFLLGAGSAALAGACVEPILLATLVLTAKWCAAGRLWAVALPFVLGAGLGLPWPFAAAGLAVLPKPGAWMRWVNRAFSLILFAAAVWYGLQAVRGFRARAERSAPSIETASASTDRPTLYIVGAPWCRNCAAMARTTLQDPRVRTSLARFDVRHVEINAFEELADHPVLSKAHIRGLPAYVIVSQPSTPNSQPSPPQ